MKYITTCICFLVMVMMAAGLKAQSTMEVSRAVICTAVENRQPVGGSDTFSNTVEKLYLFSEIHQAGSPKKIKHVWYYANKEVSVIDLQVDGMRWRTWSNKSIRPNAIGEWHVEIQDNEGNVLVRVPFRIEK